MNEPELHKKTMRKISELEGWLARLCEIKDLELRNKACDRVEQFTRNLCDIYQGLKK